MPNTDIEVPFMAHNGNPIHKVSKDDQDSYMIGLDDNQKREILQHAAALSNNLRTATTQRAEIRKSARKEMMLPANATAEQISARNAKMEKLKEEYDRLEKDITKAKGGVYKVKADGTIVKPAVRIM